MVFYRNSVRSHIMKLYANVIITNKIEEEKTIQPLILSYFPNNACAVRIVRTRCSWTIEGNAKRKKQIFKRVLISHWSTQETMCHQAMTWPCYHTFLSSMPPNNHVAFYHSNSSNNRSSKHDYNSSKCLRPMWGARLHARTCRGHHFA